MRRQQYLSRLRSNIDTCWLVKSVAKSREILASRLRFIQFISYNNYHIHYNKLYHYLIDQSVSPALTPLLFPTYESLKKFSFNRGQFSENSEYSVNRISSEFQCFRAPDFWLPYSLINLSFFQSILNGTLPYLYSQVHEVKTNKTINTKTATQMYSQRTDLNNRFSNQRWESPTTI